MVSNQVDPIQFHDGIHLVIQLIPLIIFPAGARPCRGAWLRRPHQPFLRRNYRYVPPVSRRESETHQNEQECWGLSQSKL